MKADLQHYVPRFLLKNFSDGKKHRVYVFDKSNDRCFQVHINKIAAEKGFYDLPTGDDILTVEPSLSQLESKAAQAIRKILDQERFEYLDPIEFQTIAEFLAVQFVRTKAHRVRSEHFRTLMIEKFRRMGFSHESIGKYVDDPPGILGDKLSGMISLRNAGEYVPYFWNKRWILFKTTKKHPLFLSDNPLVLHNEVDHGPFLCNLGLAVRGIEIYLPLSSTCCLGLICPTLAEGTDQSDFGEGMFLEPFSSPMGKTPQSPSIADIPCIYRSGPPIGMKPENVTFANSLQVWSSLRYVFCEENSFGLVREMIAVDEKYRSAPLPGLE